MTLDEVWDIAPYGAPDARGKPCPLVLIEPYEPSGFYAGLYLSYGTGVRHVTVHQDGESREVPIDETIRPVRGRVLKTHPACTEVKPGEVVHFRPLNYTEAELEDGRKLYFIDERALLAVWDGYDDFTLSP